MQQMHAINLLKWSLCASDVGSDRLTFNIILEQDFTSRNLNLSQWYIHSHNEPMKKPLKSLIKSDKKCCITVKALSAIKSMWYLRPWPRYVGSSVPTVASGSVTSTWPDVAEGYEKLKLVNTSPTTCCQCHFWHFLATILYKLFSMPLLNLSSNYFMTAVLCQQW